MDTKQNDIIVQSQGEEITNIIKYIVHEAEKENVKVEQLWLPRIPDVIYTDALKEKYHYKPVKNIINPIIGEYDDPDNQAQNLLTLPLSELGNTIIFGSAGNGKELMLAGIIYSCITSHNSNEVNFYILDFGAETLTMFKNAPHVGEVVLSTDAEKIANTFKMINTVLEERKKIFTDYNGSFDFYINHGGRQIPLIVVIINNVEAFLETYNEYEDLIGQMTRDCLKYGIIFIFTTNGPNTVRYRLRQNFRQNVVLQFNDPGDYSSVIPGVRKKEPSKAYGRGMILLDAIFEFQTAFVYKEEKMSDYIKVVCEKLNNICDYQAAPIPILPENVNQEYVRQYLGSYKHIPVGVTKELLEIATIDLNSRFIYNITGDDVTAEPAFIRGVMNNLLSVPNTEIIVFDATGIFNEIEAENIVYSSDNCEKSNERLIQVIDSNDLTKTTYVFMMGVNNFLGKLSASEKTDFTNMITNSKESGNIRYIIVDNIDVIKAINFESWYKGNADMSEGIWIGNGIGNQFTLKVTTNSRVLRQEVDPGFGYVIKKGKAELMKLMSDE